MSLTDKFQIIENIQVFPKTIDYVDNYFENLICSDINIMSPYYINIIYSQLNPNDNLMEYFHKYLINIRKNIRSLIKSDNYELINLNKFVKNFITKIEYIENITKSNIILNNVKSLSTFIFFDVFVSLFIENLIISFDKDYFEPLKEYTSYIKYIGKYDDMETFNKLIDLYSKSLEKKFINQEKLPLPENIRNIYELYDIIKYTNHIQEYFKFLNSHIKLVNQNNYQIIIDKIIIILKNNSLFEIQYTIQNIKLHIIKLAKSQVFISDTNIDSVFAEVFYMIDKTEQSDDYNNVFYLIDIVKFIDIIFINCETSKFKLNKEIIITKMGKLMSSDKIIDMIHNKIDDYMKNEQLSDTIKVLSYCNNIKDKDVFINKYYEYCKNRLMIIISIYDNIDKYINNENQIYEYFKLKFGEKNVYKLKKIIEDIKSSHENLITYKECNKKITSDNLSILTTSYKNWDINQSEGIINSKILKNIGNTNMGITLRNYKKYYESIYQNKRILYYSLHFGEINITYLNQTFIMLPIQFCILELFNNTNQLNISNIYSAPFFENYSKKFINDTMGSLILSGLLKINNNIVTLISSGTFKTNLIEIFMTNSEYSQIWMESKQQELAHSREQIIQANINHFVKTKNMNSIELFNMVKQNINLFELEQEVFNKGIEYMVQHKYIKLDCDNYIKLIW